MEEAIPILAIVGRSNSGKTTLLERLIPEMQRRGYRVAAVKHLYHRAEFDVPGKDSWRLAQAGADQVILAAPDRVIRIRRWAREPTLAEAVADVRGVDLILVEGHKRADVAKIEVSRRARATELACAQDERLVAVVSDQRFSVEVPQFEMDDVAGLADWLVERFLEGAEE